MERRAGHKGYNRNSKMWKTTLLRQYQEYLKRNGVSEEQIVTVNFEDLDYEELQDYQKLYGYLK